MMCSRISPESMSATCWFLFKPPFMTPRQELSQPPVIVRRRGVRRYRSLVGSWASAALALSAARCRIGGATGVRRCPVWDVHGSSAREEMPACDTHGEPYRRIMTEVEKRAPRPRSIRPPLSASLTVRGILSVAVALVSPLVVAYGIDLYGTGAMETLGRAPVLGLSLIHI